MYTGRVIDKKTLKPIANLAVSDGQNIVFTDADGNYSLAGWEKSRTVSVMALTEAHDDWFVYTDGKAGEYNFEISPVKAEGNVSFLHTSDTEIHERENVVWISTAKDVVEKTAPTFLVHTGDICRKAGLEKHYKLMNNETVGCPVRYVIGNHDYCDGDYGEQLYEQLYGPVWCSFDCGDVHFVVLSLCSGEKPELYSFEDQWIWLKNDLEQVAKGRPVVVLDHDSAPDEKNYVIQAKEFELDLKKYNLIAWVFGHYHMNFYHNRNGVANICTTCPDCGGADSSAAALRLITVSGNSVKTKMFYDGLTENLQDSPKWQTKLCGNIEFCELTEYENDLIAATMRDDFPMECGIYRIDRKDGSIRWFFETEGGIRNNVSICDGKIYAQDTMGKCYCIEADSGKLLWEKEFDFTKPDFSRQPATLVKDFIFTGRNRDMYAIDKKTGEEKWKWSFRRGSNSAAMPIYDEKTNRIVLSNHWRFMACLDADTGEELWRNDDIVVWHRNSTPVVEDGIIYTCSDFEIGKLDIISGEIIQKEKVDSELNTVGTPVMYDNLILFPTAKKGVVAFDKNTLKKVREYPASHSHLFTVPYIYNEGEAQMVESSPVIKDNTLIFGASDGKVYFYDINTAKLLNTITVCGPVLVKPLLIGDDIYIADLLGNVYKY